MSQAFPDLLGPRHRINTTKAVRFVQALDNQVPADAPTSITVVVSAKGVPGVRVSGITRGKAWDAELYGGNFYLLKVQGLETTTVPSLLSALLFLRRHLTPTAS